MAMLGSLWAHLELRSHALQNLSVEHSAHCSSGSGSGAAEQGLTKHGKPQSSKELTDLILVLPAWTASSQQEPKAIKLMNRIDHQKHRSSSCITQVLFAS